MKRRRSGETPGPAAPDEREPGLATEGEVRGERSTPTVSSVRSLQSRASSILACGLMILLGGGMLTWYYGNALSRQSRERSSAQSAMSRKAQGEMPLPGIDALSTLRTSIAEAATGNDAAPVRDHTVGGSPPDTPPLPAQSSAMGWIPIGPAGQSHAAYQQTPRKSAGQLALERLLRGAAFSRESISRGTSAAVTGAEEGYGVGGTAESGVSFGAGAGTGMGPASAMGLTALQSADLAQSSGDIAPFLHATAIVSTRARVLPTRRFLLSKGAFIDCTLETAIDSTLPGMTTCVTATDTFGSDGTVVLLERGTKLIGETRGQVQQGIARVFVLWTEARTPTGVAVPLDSPGTDELGRSGLSGAVNRHFWERFGAAILISTLDGGVQAAVQSASRGGGPVIYNPSGSATVLEDILKSTVNIPPTINKRNGDRIQVFVARDVDFRSVYELRTVNSH